MVNKPLIRPYFLGGVALGGVARISMSTGSLGHLPRIVNHQSPKLYPQMYPLAIGVI